MSPRRRVLWCALIPAVIFAASYATPAAALSDDYTRTTLGFPLATVDRSPSLLGMGQLELVGDDPHNRISLWDFAGNPIGIADAETTSTVDLYPAAGMHSSVVDLSEAAGSPYLRQTYSGHQAGAGYEVWRRTGRGRTAYGLAGDLQTAHTDQAFSDDVERQTAVGEPSVMGVLTGNVPYLKSDHWHYAFRLAFTSQSKSNEYRSILSNSQGQFIDENGMLLETPNFFDPKDYSTSTKSGGAGVGYNGGRAFQVAAMVDGLASDIKGTNDASRHSSEVTESRPYWNYQLSSTGKVGRSLDWGVDGRYWNSSSEQRWRFSISAGIGTEPLTGRGKLLEREENGGALRTRLNWTHGPFVVGARYAALQRNITITPPAITDQTSLSYFMNHVYYRQNADSLAMPDSVVYNETKEKAWEASGGLGWHLPQRKGMLGLEYHYHRSTTDQLASGAGPHGSGWDIRSGLEYRCTAVMTGRVGYAYRWQDADELTRLNEENGQTLTLGLGIQPAGTHWSLEAGYGIEWFKADYGSTVAPHGSRQMLATQIHWTF